MNESELKKKKMVCSALYNGNVQNLLGHIPFILVGELSQSENLIAIHCTIWSGWLKGLNLTFTTEMRNRSLLTAMVTQSSTAWPSTASSTAQVTWSCLAELGRDENIERSSYLNCDFQILCSHLLPYNIRHTILIDVHKRLDLLCSF